MSNDNICYFSHGDQRYPIEIAPFYRAPQQAQDYWRDEHSFLLPADALITWFQYEGQYYAAQYLSDLRQEFMALTGQSYDCGGVPF